jgi:uncharacterized membrane protein (DUF4010 family)
MLNQFAAVPEDLLGLAQRLGLAIAIGFLVGVERGWKQRHEADGARVAGLRTFTLSGCLGGLSGALFPLVGPLPTAALILAFAATFVVFHLKHAEADKDASATSVIAGLLVFALGLYAVVGNPVAASGAGVATAGILAFKDALHGWLRRLTWPEIRSAFLILVATFIALPLLPSAPIDPWGAVNPRSLWMLTILVAVASFGGYAALRALGPSSGLIAGAIAGSVVSSTAVTLDVARRAHAEQISTSQGLLAAALASIVMIVRVCLLTGTFSSQALMMIAPAAAAAATVFALTAIGALIRHSEPDGRTGYEAIHSPLDLREIGRFALLLCTATVLAKIIAANFGSAGLTAFAATAGLVDVDAVTLAVADLVRAGGGAEQAAAAILIAAGSNTMFKVVAASIPGRSRFRFLFFGISLAALLAGASAWQIFTG